MSTIKNIHKLAGILPAAEIEKLEAGAALHLRHSNITFKIISISGPELVVKTEQGKSFSENYATDKILIERTRELFGKFFPDYVTIKVQPVQYQEAPVNIVDSAWIKKKMLEKGIKIKDIVRDTGLNKTSLSAVINDSKPLSQINKAFFYYYFIR